MAVAVPTNADRSSSPTAQKPSKTPLLKISTQPDHPAFSPIALAHFDELWSIWTADKRIPTARSRKQWSAARNLNPINVNMWWGRRKARAKKSGIPIPEDTYELPVGTPPVIEDAKEEFRSSEPPRKKIKTEETLDPSVRSDSPTRTLCYPSTPSPDDFTFSSSSHTAFSSPPPSERAESPQERAYSQVDAHPMPPPDRQQSPPRITTPLPSSSPALPSSPPNSTSPDSKRSTPARDQHEFIGDPLQHFCNSGDGELYCATFFSTCFPQISLFLETHVTHEYTYLPESDPNTDEFQDALPETEDVRLLYSSYPSYFSASDPTNNSPAYISLPLTTDSEMLMQLSAIPFLSRSPDFFLPPTSAQPPNYPKIFPSPPLDLRLSSNSNPSTWHLDGSTYSYDGFCLGPDPNLDETQLRVGVGSGSDFETPFTQYALDGECFHWLPPIDDEDGTETKEIVGDDGRTGDVRLELRA